ncbi:hypothetical protein M3Y97_00960500 [Aphelenchoides bicaudatus]|nr:hypothetical protein M3Y97_00960500 [Aphelenchoides bicaudatus]
MRFKLYVSAARISYQFLPMTAKRFSLNYGEEGASFYSFKRNVYTVHNQIGRTIRQNAHAELPPPAYELPSRFVAKNDKYWLLNRFHVNKIAKLIAYVGVIVSTLTLLFGILLQADPTIRNLFIYVSFFYLLACLFLKLGYDYMDMKFYVYFIAISVPIFFALIYACCYYIANPVSIVYMKDTKRFHFISNASSIDGHIFVVFYFLAAISVGICMKIVQRAYDYLVCQLALQMSEPPNNVFDIADPKRDDLQIPLDGFCKSLECFHNSLKMLEAGAQSNKSTPIKINGSVHIVCSDQEKDSNRYRVFCFNWTYETLQNLTYFIGLLGLFVAGTFLFAGSFTDNKLDPLLYHIEFTLGPIIHGISCLFLLAGIHFKKFYCYCVWLILNMLILFSSVTMFIPLILLGQKNNWPDAHMMIPLLHLISIIPLVFVMFIVAEAAISADLKVSEKPQVIKTYENMQVSVSVANVV